MSAPVLPDLSQVLNPEQYRAATTVDGPLLVLAGAGSGKTRVLIHRIAHILATGKAKPWQILAVTFTNKAAAEMRERLVKLIGPEAHEAWIGTFHSTAARILRLEGRRLGYLPGFTIYDADDSKRLLKKIMVEMNIDVKGPMVNLRSVNNQIDKAKNAGWGPSAFSETVSDFSSPVEKITKAVYFKYQKALKSANAMDFGDLVRLATDLLRDHEEAFQRFGRRFRYVTVDEFQDTNAIQYAFLRQLTRAHRNLMVVGDDDQSIYRWRGAEIEHILGFEDEYPDAEVVKLEQNYRSTQNIIAAASSVISHNRSRHPKVLFTDAPAGKPVGLARVDDGYAEAELIARLIAQSIDDGREPSEHAILYRMNAQSRSFEEALRKARLPYRLLAGTAFYDRAEVKDVLAYLRLIANPVSTGDFDRAVNTPTRGIGAKSLERLRAAAGPRGLEGLRQLDLSDEILKSSGLSKGAIDKLRGFGRLIAELTEYSKGVSAAEAATEVVDRIGYLAHLERVDPRTAEDRVANVEELVASIAEHEQGAEGGAEGFGVAAARTPLEAYLDQASLAAGERGEGDEEGVKLLTLHAAKGLEFPVVYLVGLEEKTFPSARAMDEGSAMIEEERRLCYVGITRAMEELTLSFARIRTVFAKTETRQPSRFLGELPDEVVVAVGGRKPRVERSTRPSLAPRDPWGDDDADDWLDDAEDDDPNPFFDEGPVAHRIEPSGPAPGGSAHHNTFGPGTILAVEGKGPTARLKVRFADGVDRTVVAKYLSLD